jgi:hypothetical protein
MAQQTQLQMERWKREDQAKEEERREREVEREAKARQLELEAQERERQERQRQREFQQLTDTVTALTIAQAKPKLQPPKLEPLSTGDMLDGEFTRFEAHMATFAVQAGFLTQLVYQLLDMAEKCLAECTSMREAAAVFSQ